MKEPNLKFLQCFPENTVIPLVVEFVDEEGNYLQFIVRFKLLDVND